MKVYLVVEQEYWLLGDDCDGRLQDATIHGVFDSEKKAQICINDKARELKEKHGYLHENYLNFLHNCDSYTLEDVRDVVDEYKDFHNVYVVCREPDNDYSCINGGTSIFYINEMEVQ